MFQQILSCTFPSQHTAFFRCCRSVFKLGISTVGSSSIYTQTALKTIDTGRTNITWFQQRHNGVCCESRLTQRGDSPGKMVTAGSPKGISDCSSRSILAVTAKMVSVFTRETITHCQLYEHHSWVFILTNQPQEKHRFNQSYTYYIYA